MSCYDLLESLFSEGPETMPEQEIDDGYDDDFDDKDFNDGYEDEEDDD